MLGYIQDLAQNSLIYQLIEVTPGAKQGQKVQVFKKPGWIVKKTLFVPKPNIKRLSVRFCGKTKKAKSFLVFTGR